MILFAAAGSWGEVQPLLALAQQFRGRFACDAKWSGFASEYLPADHLCEAPDHDHTVGGFLESLDFDQIFAGLESLADTCNPSAIVSSFYLSPAKIVAELRGIPWIATTTSPVYFSEMGEVSPERMLAIGNKLNAIRERVGLKPERAPYAPEKVLGLYPWFLMDSEVLPAIGYPRLPPLVSITSPLPAKPYCVVSSGSIAMHEARADAEKACADMGLECMYLGGPEYPFSPKFTHMNALKYADAAIIHGGVGTLVDAIDAKVPIIVRPLYFDNFYNAAKLHRRGAALWPDLNAKRVDVEVETNSQIFQSFVEIMNLWGVYV